MITPITFFFKAFGRRAITPMMEAKTPPRSMSATSTIFVLNSSATKMFERSLSIRFSSTGLPAPSATIHSYSLDSFLNAFFTWGLRELIFL